MMRGTFRQKLRNNAAVISVGVIVGLTGIGVMLGRNCDGKKTICKKTPMVETTRNNGLCEPGEEYPYLRDKKGRELKDKNGKRIHNPNYSKIDCHRGDNVCDDGTTIGSLRDPTGKPIPKEHILSVGNNKIRLLDGRVYTLPLENKDSYDCQMVKVLENPCSEAPDAPPVTRPLLTKIDPDTLMIHRRQSYIEKMFRKPSLVKFGNNFIITVPNGYRESEVCTATLPVCDPDVPTECRCPNHKSCAPDTCGNGQIDKIKKKINGRTVPWTEECDPKYHDRKYNLKVRKGYYCHPISCKWVKKIRCGNNKREGNEQCDGTDNSRCGPNKRCNSRCRCEPRDPPPPPDAGVRCGNNRVERGEQCDPPGSKCGTNGTCTGSCTCKEKPPPPRPTSIKACEGDRKVTAVVRTLKRQLKGSARSFAAAYGHKPPGKVRVIVKVIMGSNGVGQSYSVSSRCSGGDEIACPKSSLSGSRNRSLFGSLNVSDFRINAQGVKCHIAVGKTVPSNAR